MERLIENYTRYFMVGGKKYYKVCQVGWYCGESPLYITTDYEDALRVWRKESRKEKYFHYEWKCGEENWEYQIREMTQEEYIKCIKERIGCLIEDIIEKKAKQIENENTKNAYREGYMECQKKYREKLTDINHLLDYEFNLGIDRNYKKLDELSKVLNSDIKD